VKIEGLDKLTNLTELYLSDQGIKAIEGLETLTELTIIDLANNPITSLDGVQHLPKLEDLWMNDNKVAEWTEVDKLAGVPSLRTVYLERNPIYHADPASYRRKVMMALPQVTQIDATACR